MPDVFVDPVIENLHAVRSAMLDAAGGDIRQLMRQVAEHQKQSQHAIIAAPFRSPKSCRSDNHAVEETSR